MLRILHISDLHLGKGGAWPIGDYTKTELIDEEQRLTRHDMLRGTLDAVAKRLEEAGATLDALVISGDVSFMGAEEGFTALADLLANLGGCGPGPGRTLVVPGNHDVAWTELPDSTARYELFVKHMRGAGYVTPLLEGIDVSSVDGHDVGAPHDPLLDLGDAVLVAINSSNYCGTLESLGDLTEDDLVELRTTASAGDGRLTRLLKRFDDLRLVDMCKVSKGQTEALGRRLQDLDGDGSFRLKVAVLHHQLLPVTLEEEVKPYETMVNLGFFRQWLAASGTHLVLHGHKHSAGAYVDLPGASPLLRPGQSLGRGFVMVSSVATANRERPTEIARLIEIGRPGARSRSISISAISPTYPKLGLVDSNFTEVASALVPQMPVEPRIAVFEGETVDDVYHQLLAAFPSESYAPVNDVVCRVVRGESCSRLPSDYPVPEGEDPEEWFAETVAWWQNAEPLLRPPQFNHGAKLRRYAHNVDQFAVAMTELRRSGTSRGVMVLLDPCAPQGPNTMFPALCLVQMRIPKGTGRLDCIAYFRKQQMRAWWPINMGELADLQKKAVDHLGGIVPGEILTVSALAIGGSDRPRVAMPRIDRWSQDKPGRLWDLVLATLNPTHPDRTRARDEWRRLFSDWRPGADMERDGVPVALRGLDALADAVETCAGSFPDERTSGLVMELRDVSRINHNYWNHDSSLVDDDTRRAEFQMWQPTVNRAIDRVLERVEALLTTSENRSG
jgi:3',5'-cyclic AMP phosphodiesterase CpdA